MELRLAGPGSSSLVPLASDPLSESVRKSYDLTLGRHWLFLAERQRNHPNLFTLAPPAGPSPSTSSLIQVPSHLHLDKAHANQDQDGFPQQPYGSPKDKAEPPASSSGPLGPLPA